MISVYMYMPCLTNALIKKTGIVVKQGLFELFDLLVKIVIKLDEYHSKTKFVISQ